MVERVRAAPKLPVVLIRTRRSDRLFGSGCQNHHRSVITTRHVSSLDTHVTGPFWRVARLRISRRRICYRDDKGKGYAGWHGGVLQPLSVLEEILPVCRGGGEVDPRIPHHVCRDLALASHLGECTTRAASALGRNQ